MIRGLFLAILALIAVPLAAQDKAPPAPYANVQLEDAALEAQATELMETLRCLTCQSQSIADSDAPIAGDMRHQVRARLLAGDTPDEVRGWLVERYGDYVSYTPQVSSTTWPLFAVPLVVILVVLLVLWRRLSARKIKSESEA
ncbi:MAG: cytochrome c-type biogenesis protein [Pseudomonadota bacterium]